MGEKKVTNRLFILSAVSYFISAVSIWLIPVSESSAEATGSVSYVPGILFWAGLAAGIIFWAMAFMKCRQTEEYKKVKISSRPGFISFFTDKAAMAADLLLVVSLVITVLSAFIRMNYILSLGSLFVLLFTFHLHYLLNGRVYKYLKSKRTKNLSGMSEEKKGDKL